MNHSPTTKKHTAKKQLPIRPSNLPKDPFQAKPSNDVEDVLNAGDTTENHDLEMKDEQEIGGTAGGMGEQSKNKPGIESLPASSSKPFKTPFYMSYQQFVNHLEYKNNGRIKRDTAEKLWKSSCEDVYKKWKPDGNTSLEMKEHALAKALAQMNGGLKGQFDIEAFWSSKEEMYEKKEIEKKRALRKAKKEHFRNKAGLSEKK